jgi:competence protein ComEC
MAKPLPKAIATAAVLLSVITAVTISVRQEDVQPNSPLASDEIRVHYIDVGQGDATLIQSADNAVLIDGGDTKTQKKYINYLRSTGITSIDYVIATHPHDDHIGGLPQVIQQFTVKDILMLDTVIPSSSFKQLVTVMEAKGIKFAQPAVGDTFAAGIIKFTALAPAKKIKGLNDMSIVVRMVYGETAFLFTSDAEARSEREMLKSELTLRADVLKAGHHGSGSFSTSEFLDAVHPSVVIISCGKKNTYGFPAEKVLTNIIE